MSPGESQFCRQTVHPGSRTGDSEGAVTVTNGCTTTCGLDRTGIHSPPANPRDIRVMTSRRRCALNGSWCGATEVDYLSNRDY